jgi:hypothetical protein
MGKADCKRIGFVGLVKPHRCSLIDLIKSGVGIPEGCLFIKRLKRLDGCDCSFFNLGFEALSPENFR